MPERNPGRFINDDFFSQLVVSIPLRDIQRLLASLPARDRAALILYYWYEYSYAELAKALSLSEPALKARLHRARRTLAATWQQNLGNPLFARRSLYEKTIG